MKLESIRILGMHNVTDKTYTANDILTYYHGPNGVGKSTILQAIQLVLLGYIPGYAKTNEAVLKHSPGSELQVVGKFDDGTIVTRRWFRKGASATSASECVPAREKIDLVDENLELPIYNFNEFKDMTANKLKEWFISFLPSVDNSIDWKARLLDTVGDRKAILTEEFLTETLNKIEELSTTASGVTLVQAVNAYLKDCQSFTKKEIDRLQGTVQSLVYYDEELPVGDSIEAELKKTSELLIELNAYETAINQYRSLKSQMAELNYVDDSVTCIDEAENYVEARNAQTNAKASLEEALQAESVLSDQLREAQTALNEALKITDSTCPYTNAKCLAIQELIDENKDKVPELQKTVADIQAKIGQNRLNKDKFNEDAFNAGQLADRIKSQYERFFELQKAISNHASPEKPTELTREELSQKQHDLQVELSKVEANQRYNELVDKITNDKFDAENRLEVLKMWIKLTDANGLQTELMTRPFLDLAEDMNKYIQVMFGESARAEFLLSGKANSFSFGIVKDSAKDNYIEFDYLSSGEKCLFMLAMMICILDRSDAQLRTILIDDLVDHLDDANAQKVFESLAKVENVQFIIAGVKPCEVDNVCIEL